jgi:hypothetical protein
LRALQTEKRVGQNHWRCRQSVLSYRQIILSDRRNDFFCRQSILSHLQTVLFDLQTALFDRQSVLPQCQKVLCSRQAIFARAVKGFNDTIEEKNPGISAVILPRIFFLKTFLHKI